MLRPRRRRGYQVAKWHSGPMQGIPSRSAAWLAQWCLSYLGKEHDPRDPASAHRDLVRRILKWIRNGAGQGCVLGEPTQQSAESGSSRVPSGSGAEPDGDTGQRSASKLALDFDEPGRPARQRTQINGWLYGNQTAFREMLCGVGVFR